ncbi:hypothetical protein [Patulibacter sp. SYSU D01012]|uniref:hypothetical protein n=1 Tax=Patulibacter sp. SYSU D01012 TaxID=2817381 RepID=UPI001B316B68|nr:hypothetical protein [Patulibacter sp. SYSU D01012]
MLASATSIAMTVVVARELSVNAFGTFALIASASAFLVGCGRAYVAEPQLVRYAAIDQIRRRASLRLGVEIYSSMLVFLSPLIGAALVTSSGGLRIAVGAAALVAGMGLIDAIRTFLAGTSRSHLSFAVSSGLLVAVSSGVFAATPHDLPDALITVGLGYAVWAVAVATVLGFGLRHSEPWRWRSREHASEAIQAHGRHFATEYVVGTGGYYAASLTASGLVGLQAAAGIRGSESMLGPIRVAVASLPNVMMATNDLDFSEVRIAVRVSAVLGIGALACYGFAIGLNQVLGEALFGASSSAVGDVLPFLALAPVFMAVSTGPILGLRRLRQSQATLKIRSFTAPLPVVGALAGAPLGISGIGAGLAGASALATVAWWTGFTRHTQQGLTGQSSTSPDARHSAVRAADTSRAFARPVASTNPQPHQDQHDS